MQQDVAVFDAGFFNFSADVASVSRVLPAYRGSKSSERHYLTIFQAMDPQLRLLLETVYEATEDG